MCQAMFGTWDTEVNKAGQKTKCYGAYILPPGAYVKLYSGVRSKLIEFLSWQIWLCVHKKNVRQEKGVR